VHHIWRLWRVKDGVTEAGLDWIVLEWSSRAALQEEWYATYIHILWELRSVDRNGYGKFKIGNGKFRNKSPCSTWRYKTSCRTLMPPYNRTLRYASVYTARLWENHKDRKGTGTSTGIRYRYHEEKRRPRQPTHRTRSKSR